MVRRSNRSCSSCTHVRTEEKHVSNWLLVLLFPSVIDRAAQQQELQQLHVCEDKIDVFENFVSAVFVPNIIDGAAQQQQELQMQMHIHKDRTKRYQSG